MEREKVFIAIIFLGFLILGARLGWLMGVEGEIWQALYEGQQQRVIFTRKERKEIYTQDRVPLVVSRLVYVLRADPQKVKEKEVVARKLSEILSFPEKEILVLLSSPVRDVVIKEDLSLKEVFSIKDLPLSLQEGFFVLEEKRRFYLSRGMGSVFLGFVDMNGKGQYGIEGFYDKYLAQEPVQEKIERWGRVRLFRESRKTSKTPFVLTIDSRIQKRAFELLEENNERLGYEKAEIIVMDPFSGEVLAHAQWPEYDPNNYAKEDISYFKVLGSQEPFEPGSIMKPFVVASALQERVITLKDTYYDKGFVDIGGWRIFNYSQKKWGKRSVAEILKYSINTGAVFVEQKLGKKKFMEYLQKLGFFESSGVDLQGEVVYENSELKKGYEVNLATASFGQGIAINSFQLLRAWSALINGGELVQPHFNLSLKPEKRRVFDKETSALMRDVLTAVVEEGSGKKARSLLWYFGGKTGTAQVPWAFVGENKRGYSPYTIQSFVGFGPSSNPKILVLVKLYKPNTLTAEYSAAPLFKEITEYTLSLYNVPPDKNIQK